MAEKGRRKERERKRGRGKKKEIWKSMITSRLLDLSSRLKRDVGSGGGRVTRKPNVVQSNSINRGKKSQLIGRYFLRKGITPLCR